MRYFLILFASTLLAQVQPQILCNASSEPLQIRAEGVAERVGLIALNCSGTPNLQVSASLYVAMSAPVTNKLTNNVIDAQLTLETPGGLLDVGGSPQLIGNQIVFSAFSFTMPASGNAILRISNIRVVADPSGAGSVVTALISTQGLTGIGINVINANQIVGVPRRSLYQNAANASIFCRGMVLPDDFILNFNNLVAVGARFGTIRATEGWPAAFETRATGATNGVRLMLRYSGVPANARIFVPDLIAGSSAQNPTSAGDLGFPTSGGVWNPGAGGSLLLARVANPDVNGGGGSVSFNPAGATQPVSLNGVSELYPQGGQAFAVWEVVDSNGSALEFAQLPTFITLPPGSPSAVATASLSLAPVSTLSQASANLPIVRFIRNTPPADCTLLRDCNANYFPRLVIDAPELSFTIPQNQQGYFQKFIRILNDSSGSMEWALKINYISGADWLQIDRSEGRNNASVNLSFLPGSLTPGQYQAELIIDAGFAGTKRLPVTLTVTNPLPVPPTISSVSGAVAGSLATITGQRLVGQSMQVTLDGIAATVTGQQVTTSAETLTVLLPSEIAGRQAVQLQATRDGIASQPRTVALELAAPRIRSAGGVLNQDGSGNSQAAPETTGNYFQVFATGLPLASQGVISAKIHDRWIDSPAYAGPAPNQPGMQQVNFQIPADLPAMSTEVRLCGASLANPTERICSAPVLAWIARPANESETSDQQ